jgi:hypothetical protein
VIPAGTLLGQLFGAAIAFPTPATVTMRRRAIPGTAERNPILIDLSDTMIDSPVRQPRRDKVCGLPLKVDPGEATETIIKCK